MRHPAGPRLGEMVQITGTKMVGKAVAFNLRTDEYAILIPADEKHHAVRLTIKKERVEEVEEP